MENSRSIKQSFMESEKKIQVDDTPMFLPIKSMELFLTLVRIR